MTPPSVSSAVTRMIDPAKVSQRFGTSDVFVELPPVGPVMVAVVFHREF